MNTDLQQLTAKACAEIASANDIATLDALRVSYLGKKGLLTEQLKALGSLPAADRREAGQAINLAKTEVANAIDARRTTLERVELDHVLSAERSNRDGRSGLPVVADGPLLGETITRRLSLRSRRSTP